jgi:hypothetical protein
MLDEVLFMSAGIIKVVVLPVAQQNGSCVIGLSTPSGQDTPCTKLFNTKDPDTGRTIFLIVRIGKPCDSCQAKRILCVHNEHATGEGLSRKKRSLMQCFFVGDEQSAMQEFQGVAADHSHHIFLPKYMERLLAKDPYPIARPSMLHMQPIDMIMVSIDPAGGGPCEWGLCACYYDIKERVQVILQIDNQTLKDVSSKNIQKWLYKSIHNIRLIDEAFASVPIVIACEAAPNIIADQLAIHVQHLIVKGRLTNTFIMREVGDDRPGVLKTHDNTQDMSRYTAMMLENGQIYFSEKYCTSIVGKTREQARSDLFDQMGNFKKRQVFTTTGTYIIKIDGKSGGKHDDLVVAMAMNFLHYLLFMLSTKPCYETIKAQLPYPSKLVTIDHFRYSNRAQHAKTVVPYQSTTASSLLV